LVFAEEIGVLEELWLPPTLARAPSYYLLGWLPHPLTHSFRFSKEPGIFRRHACVHLPAGGPRRVVKKVRRRCSYDDNDDKQYSNSESSRFSVVAKAKQSKSTNPSNWRPKQKMRRRTFVGWETETWLTSVCTQKIVINITSVQIVFLRLRTNHLFSSTQQRQRACIIAAICHRFK